MPFFRVLLLYLVLAAPNWGTAQTELQFWTISLSPFFNDYINETVSLYEAQHPGVSVTWRDFSGEALGFELLGAIQSGHAPDVVNLNVPMLLEQTERGNLSSLEGSFDKDLYFDGLLQSLTVQGTLYALPWYVTPAILMVNRGLFAEAGLDADTFVSTPDTLVAAAEQIKDRSGVYGFMPNLISQNLLYRFQEAGLPVLSEDGTRAVFNSPAHVAFLQEYISLFEKDYFPADALLKGYGGALERYQSGQLGMLLTGAQFLTRIRESAPEVYAETVPLSYPLGAGRTVHAPLMALGVPAASKHQQEALDFALFVTGRERELAFSKLVAIFPSNVEAAADPFFTTLPPTPTPEERARAVTAGQLEYAHDLTLHVPNASDLFRNFQKNVEEAFFGFKSPQAALDDAVRYWNAKL